MINCKHFNSSSLQLSDFIYHREYYIPLILFNFENFNINKILTSLIAAIVSRSWADRNHFFGRSPFALKPNVINFEYFTAIRLNSGSNTMIKDTKIVKMKNFLQKHAGKKGSPFLNCLSEQDAENRKNGLILVDHLRVKKSSKFAHLQVKRKVTI